MFQKIKKKQLLSLTIIIAEFFHKGFSYHWKHIIFFQPSSVVFLYEQFQEPKQIFVTINSITK